MENGIKQFEVGKTYFVYVDHYEVGYPLPPSIRLAKVIKRTKCTVTVEVGYKGSDHKFVKTCKVRDYYKGQETILPDGIYAAPFTSENVFAA